MRLLKTGLVVLSLAFAACGGGDPQAPEARTAPEERSAQASQEATEIGEAARAYDAVRERLANDETDGLASAFERLEQAARESSEDDAISEAAAEHLRELSVAAAKGAGAGDEDLKGARAAFGEASEHLVAAVAAEPALGRGLHLFECPMTEGYPKWAQMSDAMANPYMGKAMQTCGAASGWTE